MELSKDVQIPFVACVALLMVVLLFFEATFPLLNLCMPSIPFTKRKISLGVYLLCFPRLCFE
jgi:hypothetical protein